MPLEMMSHAFVYPMAAHVALTAVLYALLTVARAPTVWGLGRRADGSNPWSKFDAGAGEKCSALMQVIVRRFAVIPIVLVALALASPTASAASVTEVDAEISRLEIKYTGNRSMLGLLSELRRSWHAYYHAQCAFEKAVYTGGNVLIKGGSREAFVAERDCKKRIRDEMLSVLSRY